MILKNKKYGVGSMAMLKEQTDTEPAIAAGWDLLRVLGVSVVNRNEDPEITATIANLGLKF